MRLFPNNSFGLLNIWWYLLLYGVISVLVMINIPKDKRKKLLTFPKYNKDRKISIWGFISFAFGKGLITYTIFSPIHPFSLYFYVGTSIYLIGLFLSVYAMWIFSKAELSQPVTNGLYKISRHPIQVMNFIMWLGIAIVSETWIMIICAISFAIFSYPSLKAQEKNCIDQYGDNYYEYMKKTPRYLLF
ncbi:DUF1295 domain-containing protein [Clostridium sp. 'deep sea']|uniref:methyltransferase family protein n=1 Tax=Clostridium sp. 'deep sea' TaxID=2779445 RepID=UPI0018965F65|nr:methyltransferase [Clostridium sp. 'deep sea']QOR35194.1 DUF1295 domain-containing protein [Clostridium sp. 'deep sea']